ncbi:hypothetical protein SCHPADRAFT_898858 [Schizopora paradoxa]|uniref:Ataxin-10 homolog n=1 Tax=Schizopora paradoxa TaxID=27342 RepID=A0A0H2S4U3_9AGAM|nr:hypothetical protein SCHPADRAFT_898858 [Schizopora paradoxa]
MNASLESERLCSCLRCVDDHIYLRRPLEESEISYLDGFSANLAKSSDLRSSIGQSTPSLWPILSSIWKHICAPDAQISNLLLLTVTKVTRNICPNCPQNQDHVFEFETCIRETAFRFTSFFTMEDKESHVATRFLVQTLSNMVTSNEPLISRLWSTYIALPEEQNVLIRILGHPDRRTVMAGLVLVANCTSDNKHRLGQLITSGTRLCVVLLDLLAKEVDGDETDPVVDVFEIGWSIFCDAFHHGLALDLFSSISIDGEIVTPHQTTLFKVLDSYLLHHAPAGEENGYEFLPLLTAKFFELSGYVCLSIRNTLDASPSVTTNSAATITDDTAETAPLRKLDVLLPKVCQTIVLVTQCLCTLSLGNERIDVRTAERSKRHMIDATSQGTGLIESLIDLLRELDRFLPRLILGKESFSDGRPAPTGGPDLSGFNHLKRDLVRLLGILCYEERAVQDRIRMREGITVVMNLCVTDERNPYLREHALFTLRNLLLGNEENQAVVQTIRPMGSWDVDGQLRDVIGVRK